MTWYTLYRDADGAFIGHGTSTRTPVAGETRLEHTERQDQGSTWNPVTTAWEALGAPTVIGAAAFFERFTSTEQVYAALYADGAPTGDTTIDSAATQAKRDAVKASLGHLDRFVAYRKRVDLEHPFVGALVDPLVTAGIIDAARKTTILTP